MPKTRRGKRTSRATKKPTAPARTSKTLDAVSEAQTTAASLTESEKTAPHAPDPSLGPRTKGDVDSSHSLSSILSGIEDCEAMQLSREFRKLCSQHANPSYAASMAQYMRNQFSFFGIKAPERRRLQKQFTSTHKDKLTSRPFLLQFTVSLWQLDERECQLYGVDLASEFRKEMLGETRAEYEEAVACMESLLTTKSWWDTVDLLASQSEQTLDLYLHSLVSSAREYKRCWGSKVITLLARGSGMAWGYGYTCTARCLSTDSGGLHSESETRVGSGTNGAVDWPFLHVAQEDCTTTPGIYPVGRYNIQAMNVHYAS